jgi:tRNA-splicing ligase RtcB (3'-phosphate/5'-hydroxy nucleic acid ligase)
MGKLKLSGKDLRAIGYPQGPVISAAISTITEHYPQYTKNQVLKILEHVLLHPVNYQTDAVLGKIASFLIPKPKDESLVDLNSTGVPIHIFGKEFIEAGAIDQINTAARLPVSVAAALMPDAHQGYGLTIGGVLATHNAVIPYGVGVDIGCRMCLSIFDINPAELTEKEAYFSKIVDQNTLFGAGKEFAKNTDHEVLYNPAFREIHLLHSLYDTAAKQIGSSGSGNHFVEFGVIDVKEADEILGVPAGKYVGLLSHSGSRALGANVANHFTKIAKERRKLPSSAANLAWLNLDESEGAEYWIAMNLAGDYASACHHIIHQKIAAALNREPVRRVENHHNFAWKEVHDGKEVIVHRKGATPAGKNVLGIIPGSMTAPGFVVKGRGDEQSLASASHGAGRKMSRTAALKEITHHTLQETLKEYGVTLMGGGLDEAPLAYKDIYRVMQAQHHLVDTVGLFHPKIVKMDDSLPKQWKKKRNVVAGE